ncbi:MBOAT family protein [Ferrovibrio sp.]|uniref:MBOAT family O-acyltransferase n=1 Tax=Ferrovibrio sp. TaxID=1917215 RepID=UPI0035B45FA5
MLFSSPIFLAFFAVYYAIHRLLRAATARIWLIVLGGSFFYAWWKPAYLPLPLLLTTAGFLAAIWLTASGRRGPVALVIVLALLLLPLLFFKYTDFAYSQLGGLFGWEGALIGLPLPLGISFITFTLIAYVVDVWQGKFPLERRWSMLAGYVMFFPHAIAGPILRPHELLPQLDRVRRLKILPGVLIFSVGLFKKLAVADQIAAAIDPIFANPMLYSAPQIWFAAYGFSIQIYCDFSGYTDMAIGLAILLGVRLPTNFRQPYSAFSIVDFWRRWHITLSHWLRDYLYIPMGGNRRGPGRRVLAVVATMAIGGLWHGANWTFIIWGLLHGGAVAAVQGLRRYGFKLPTPLAWLFTFHFVVFAWIFFRAKDVQTAWVMLERLFIGGIGDLSPFLQGLAFPLLLIIATLVVHRFDDHRRLRAATRYLPVHYILPVVFMLWLLAFTLSAGNSAAFIYFDF